MAAGGVAGVCCVAACDGGGIIGSVGSGALISSTAGDAAFFLAWAFAALDLSFAGFAGDGSGGFAAGESSPAAVWAFFAGSGSTSFSAGCAGDWGTIAEPLVGASASPGIGAIMSLATAGWATAWEFSVGFLNAATRSLAVGFTLPC